MGFAIGDLWINRPNERGQTIVASCNTTHESQTDLMNQLFGPYGPVRVSGHTVRASLDDTFAFLLEKYQPAVPNWISGPDSEAAFAAGYADAEGSCGIYDGRARFKISSYDSHILRWFHDWCRRIGVHANLRRIAVAGDPRPKHPPYPQDLWCLTVNQRLDLLRVIATLTPFLRHSGRIAQLDRARTNVLERLRVP